MDTVYLLIVKKGYIYRMCFVISLLYESKEKVSFSVHNGCYVLVFLFILDDLWFLTFNFPLEKG